MDIYKVNFSFVLNYMSIIPYYVSNIKCMLSNQSIRIHLKLNYRPGKRSGDGSKTYLMDMTIHLRSPTDFQFACKMLCEPGYHLSKC